MRYKVEVDVSDTRSMKEGNLCTGTRHVIIEAETAVRAELLATQMVLSQIYDLDGKEHGLVTASRTAPVPNPLIKEHSMDTDPFLEGKVEECLRDNDGYPCYICEVRLEVLAQRNGR